MRVAVMATGALGGYFGGRLAEAGHEVHFIARGSNLAAIRANGLKVESPVGNIHIAKPKVTDNPKEVGPVDLILFAVKLWDVEKSGEASKPLVGPNTRLVSMLNGIDSVERLTPILGNDVVAGAPTRISAVISRTGCDRSQKCVRKFSLWVLGRKRRCAPQGTRGRNESVEA